MNFQSIDNLKQGKSHRESSWDRTGGNADFIRIPAGQSRIIADIKGSGRITHIWMTSWGNYRNILIKMTWDDASEPSVLVPYGDFFGQGNCFVNSFQSAYFTSSTDSNNKMNELTAMNCYLPMPFKKHAVIELINESDKEHTQYFYIDYETYDDERALGPSPAYLHAEFRRQSPFGGWAPEIRVNTPETDGIMNVERDAWENNYVIMETKGKGHYLGCFFNVINLAAKSFKGYGDPQYSWWGEGDDMIWVDGYKWPPDLHGTGSEDYFNQALGMQRNAFLRNGTAIHEFDTQGYSTSYMFHIENPVRFQKEIKVTIEIGHANHLGNDISSVAYWYAEVPTTINNPPPIKQRQPLVKKNGQWIFDSESKITTHYVPINAEKHVQKQNWSRQQPPHPYKQRIAEIILDEEKNLCANVQIVQGNMMVIPMEEVLEDFLDEILSKVMQKYIRLQIGENKPDFIVVNDRNSLFQFITSKLAKFQNQKVKMYSGIVLPDEREIGIPCEWGFWISNKLTFRD